MKKTSWILFFFIVFILLFMSYGSLINQSYQGRVWSIEQVISEYIKENNGSFPQSQQDLIDKGYIKIEYENSSLKYYIRYVQHDRIEWREWPVYLERFKILYGVERNNIVVVDGCLYEKNTNQKIFLLDGPYNRRIVPTLRDTYNAISLKWYKEMEKSSTKQENEK